MEVQIKFQMTGVVWEAAARRLRRIVVRKYEWLLAAVLAISFGLSPYLLDVRGWILSGILLVYALVAVLIGNRRALRTICLQAAGLEPCEMVYRVTDDGLENRTPGGRTYRWRDFKRLRRYPDVWLLIYDKSTAIVIPPEVLTNDLCEFIERQVREAGGKVK